MQINILCYYKNANYFYNFSLHYNLLFLQIYIKVILHTTITNTKYMKNFTRGGQIIKHNISMFRQVLKESLLYSFIISLILTIIIAIYNPPIFKKENLNLYLQASIKNYFHEIACDFRNSISVNKTRCIPAKITLNNGQITYVKNILENRVIKRDIYRLKQFVYRTSTNMLKMWFVFLIGIVLFCVRFGRLNTISQEPNVKTATDVKKYLKKTKQLGPIIVGDMPLIKGSESKHIIALGSTGSGKTNLIKIIGDQVRRSDQPAIVLDLTGEMIARYYDEKKGDILFNPSDDRSYAWDIKKELELKEKLDLFASSLFSGKATSDDFWSDSAKQAFIDIFTQVIFVQHKSIKELHNTLTRSNLQDLEEIVKGTDSQNLIDPENYKTTKSILQHIISCIGWLARLEVSDRDTFSIRSFCQEAVAKGRGSWLFFSSPRSATKLFHVFYNIILNLAKDSIIDLGPNPNRRVWLIIDELASFKDLGSLEECVAELRKYGGCVLTATQSINQLNSLYRIDTARTILDQFNTKFFFKGNIEQQILSNCLGVVELEKTHESISYGAHEMRDGVSISKSTTIKPLINSSQIASLDPLECYVILPDTNIKCAKIKVPFVG